MYIDPNDFSTLQRLSNALTSKLNKHMDLMVDMDVFDEEDDELTRESENIVILLNDIQEKNKSRTTITDEYLTEKLAELESAINSSIKYHPTDAIDKIIHKVKSGEI